MKNTILILLLSLSILCHSQINDLNQGTIKNQEYFTELHFEYSNGMIILPVTINNKTYKFLLDTGAPNCLSKNLNTILNPEVVQKIDILDANNNKCALDIVKFPDLEIGSILFQNSVGLSLNEDNFVVNCLNIDGFIGSNILRNSIIQIDIKNKILRITDKEEKLIFDRKSGIELSLIGYQSSPYIWLYMKDKTSAKEQVLIDTGMKGFYDISNRNYNLLKNSNIIKIINTGNGTKDIGMFGNANISEQLRLMIPEINISNSTFLNIATTTTDDINSRIGIDLFKYGIGTIDYINKKFYFDNFDENAIDLKENLIGFSPTIIKNKLSIGIVWDDNLKDTIHTGDEIIEVDGNNYENYQFCDLLFTKLGFEDSMTKEVTIRTKNGELKKINL